jgi:telomerase reverse transcriptase
MKRKSGSHAGGGPRKRARRADHVDQSGTATPSGPDHPVLRRLYPQVVTLRHYLLSRLPKSSKNRRRRISQLVEPARNPGSACDDDDLGIAQLLDSTLVGISFDAKRSSTQEQVARERKREIEHFTQQRSQSISGGTSKSGYLLQCEVGRVTQSQSHQAVHGIISTSGG